MLRSVSPSSAKALQTVPVPSRANTGKAASRLSAGEIARLSKLREARWRPGLKDQPLHSEVFASSMNASGAGVALELARDAIRVAFEQDTTHAANPLAEVDDRRQILWVQETRAIQRGGRLYRHGLPSDLRDRVIHVETGTPEDTLFALEEGLRCRDLLCVIGEIVGNPRALDFTASRRLSLAAEKHGIALWLVRLEAEAELSSARMRWRVEPAPSEHLCWNDAAPGIPAWQAELFRARTHAPGNWILQHDYRSRSAGGLVARKAGSEPIAPAHFAAANFSDLVRPTVGRSLAACGRV
ncbi:MAG: recA-like protein [Pseudomonadota bacterium]